MTPKQKRDLKTVRLAVKLELLSPVDAEDCLFLANRYGDKYTIEEIARRRGYLDDDDVRRLEDAAIAHAKKNVFSFSRKRRASPPPAPIAPASEDEGPDLNDGETLIMDVSKMRLKDFAPKREAAEASETREVFGRYYLERPIAHVRMGTVHLARPRRKPEQTVAIRILDDELARLRDYVARFQLGRRVASMFDHPNIERFLDGGTIDGRHFQVVPHIDGWTLKERNESNQPPGLLESLRIARDIASALEALAAAKIVHRNIKPGTILVLGDGKALLTDLGLAASMPGGPEWLTAVQTDGVATPNYVAPEQLQSIAIDERADQYALGATLFELLVRRPVQDVPASSAQPVRDLGGLEAAVPADVAAVLLRMIALEPKDRFANTRDVTQALDALIVRAEREAAAQAPAEMRESRRVSIHSWALAAAAAALLLATKIIASFGIIPTDLNAARFGTLLAGALGITIAVLVFLPLDLVRLGRLPLPRSTAWVVFLRDAVGVAGAFLLTLGLVLGPASALNVLASSSAIVVLWSWGHGVSTRRRIASLLPNRGAGRCLAILGEPALRTWRSVHVPITMVLALISIMHVAAFAYFRTK